MLDRFFLFGFALLPLVVAYLVYKIAFFIAGKIWKRVEIAKLLLKALSLPVLLIFLELAAFATLRLALIPLDYEEIAHHTLLVLLIATIGFAIASFVKAVYQYLKQTNNTQNLEDFSRRSFLTRAQILYRAVMFVIIAVTFALILMTFPQIKSFGIGILGSAGVAGLAIGLAAKPILTNLIAGFQIAFTRMLKIGDAIVIDSEFGYVEQIFLTHVILKTWDWRRIVIPISHFIDKPYQNWSSNTTELLPVVYLSCDYKADINKIREKFGAILSSTPLWNKEVSKLEVIELTDQIMRLRMMMSSSTPASASSLQSYVREKMVEFLQKEQPEALPRLRYYTSEEKA